MNPGHVFLIEDDDSLRESLSELLSLDGYQVHAWSDPQAFLREIPESAPAVLVIDVQLPGLSGVELHTEIVRRGKSLPVIYISGASTLAQGIQAMKQGALDFLLKPFEREQLLQSVARGIERHRKEIEQQRDRLHLDRSLSTLSPRERQVHALMLRGFSNAEIVQALNISLPTAKQYKSEVLRKMGTRSLSRLIELSRPGSQTSPGS